MKWRYSIITGFMGALWDRFIEYQPPRTIEEMLDRVARVKGCSGVELVYPPDFDDPAKLKGLLEARTLGVSAVNVNVKSERQWWFGSFTSPRAEVRRQAVAYVTRAMDFAKELGANLVTSAFLSDGTNYPFELDYERAFRDALEAVREAAEHDPGVRLALEYKASEPIAHCFLNNAGKAAYFASLTGCPNVGVTVDIGHALQSQEVPADTLSCLGATQKLFYVHINDNYRNWDWDLVPGTVNFWDFVEVAFALRKVGYEGWLAADVFPRRHDPVATMEKTFAWMDTIVALAERIDPATLTDLQQNCKTLEILDYVRSLVAK